MSTFDSPIDPMCLGPRPGPPYPRRRSSRFFGAGRAADRGWSCGFGRAITAILAGVPLITGCSPPPVRSAAPAAGEPHFGPTQVLARTIVTPEEALTVDELFARAQAALRRGDLGTALVDLDRVLRAEPDGPLAPRARLIAAETLEARGDHAGAAERLEQAALRHPASPEARVALVRVVRLRTFLEQWERAGIAADALITRYPDLSPIEQIVARSGRALRWVAAGDVEAASLEVERGRSVVEESGFDQAGRISIDLARLYFALGEVRRARAEATTLAARPADFAAALERRCELLLGAQSAYSATLRAYDAHWSAMAGYRIGELYQSLHEALLAMPPPASADTPARRDLFEGAMRLRYSILLEKALAMMDQTLAMAARTGERSVWVERAAAARAELHAAMDREQAALERLPYTREELKRAMDALSVGRTP